jgi:glycerol kinase
MAHILAFDQGTTSSRAIVFDSSGEIVALAQREFKQSFPQLGWVEHDPSEIWSSQVAVAEEALEKAKLKAADVTAMGITNQRETTVVWNRQTGEPIHPAIVWQDRRTAGMCDEPGADGAAEDGVAVRSLFQCDESGVDAQARRRGTKSG